MADEKYWIDGQYLEHGCCYDTAIVTKCAPGEGMYGSDIDVVCECRTEYALDICRALNEMERRKLH